MKRLSDIGEDALIKRLVAQLAQDAGQGAITVVGPGDDCAVVDVGVRGKYQLLKTDSLVEGVHYYPDTPAKKVGWKAVARVISDFAAMGGVPGHLLVTVAMPGDKRVNEMEKLYQGMQQCASAYGATICGGETSSVPIGAPAMISVSGTGWVKKSHCVTRSGGRVGDHIFVTGKLGGSIKGRHLTFSPRVDESQWLTSHFRIHSMMDLSDGMGRDLPRLAEASGCGFVIVDSDLPRHHGCNVSQALGDGEDYELMFTVSSKTSERLLSQWSSAFPDLLLTKVGELVKAGTGYESTGKRQANDGSQGWEHFSV